MNKSIRPGRLHVLNSLTCAAVLLAMPNLAFGQRRHSEEEIRLGERNGVKASIQMKYGRSTEVRITKVTEGDMVGDDRHFSGEGFFVLGRDQHDFTFEGFIDTRKIMTKGIKIHNLHQLDVRDVGSRAVLAEVQTRHGRDADPKLDEVTVSDFDRDEKRVSGTGVFRLDRGRRSFNFECLVNETTGQVRRMKIDERPGRPGRPGLGDRPGGPDREGGISDRRARDAAEAAVNDKLHTDGVSGGIDIRDSRIVETVRGQSRVEGEGSYRSTGRDHRFNFTCYVDMRTGRVERLRIDEK